MTDLALDLYVLAAALGSVPVVVYAGLPVLAQSAFMALGAVGAMQLERAGLPIGGAVLLAVAGGAVAGALVGWLLAAADRARVALATWGLAWLATTVLLAFPELSGGTQGLTRPALDRVQTPLGVTLTLTPTAHLVFAALLCAVAVGVAARLRGGPAWRDAVAAREDAEAALAAGVPVAARRASLLALAGAFATAAGAGYALLLGVAAPADTSPLLALQVFAAVIVGAGAPLLGPLLAFAVIAGVPRLASALSETGLSSEAASGVVTAAALIACLWLRPLVRVRRRGSSGMPGDAAPLAPVASAALSVRGLTDPLGILHGIDLDLHPGEIHALIGPNGSGKTTALRTLAARGAVTASGAAEPAAAARSDAAVAGNDAAVPGNDAAVPGNDAAAAGKAVPAVARTFQRGAALDPLTPYQQVELALPRERFGALLQFFGFAAAPPDPWPALRLAGLERHAHIAAGELGAGEERLLQIARAAATGAGVLALDEPAAGMRPDEREALAAVLRALADSGRAVLVVEHDLRLVSGVADVVTVLDEGRVVAHGTPDDVIAGPTLRKVYL